MNWIKYTRKGVSEMRPYIEGEAMSRVSVSVQDRANGSPKPGDMIARNPKNHDDLWLVAKNYFEDNLEAVAVAEKTLHNSDISGARQNVPDIKVVGNGDMFRLLCKASSKDEGWMKSTKAMEVHGGCVVQVTTQQKNPDGSYALAEALAYVPRVGIGADQNGGRRLVPLDALN